MRGPRKTHKKKEPKISPKKKEGKKPYKKKVAAVIGRAYTIEELGALISTLTGENTDREIQGIEEFAENKAAITEAVTKVPDVEVDEVMDLVVSAILKNEQKMLEKFQNERNAKALKFVASLPSLKPEVRKKANEILETIKPTRFQDVKIPETIDPVQVKSEYTPSQVKALVKNLESKIPKLSIPAAIKFVRDYPKITPTVSSMPLLTVTQVTIKAVDIIKKNTDRVIDIMVQKKMVPALTFLSSLGQVPLDIRNRAFKAAEKLKASLPSAKSEVKEVSLKEIKLQKSYTPFELKALLDGLGSVERVRVVSSALEFLKNYQIIAESVSRAPDISMTRMTDMAIKAINSNLTSVLKTLEKTKDHSSLTFLANSSRVPEKVKKKAQAALMRVMMAKKKAKPPFLKQKMENEDKD